MFRERTNSLEQVRNEPFIIGSDKGFKDRVLQLTKQIGGGVAGLH